jgi:MOSC domain-containing protein YiiM
VTGEPTWAGRLEHIHVAAGAGAPMRSLSTTLLVAGVGLVDDRYATRQGTYSDRHHIDRQVTLIELETLDTLARDHGVVLQPHDHRRNLTVLGVPLGHLVGRYFSVGACVLYGGRLNVPCRHLEAVTGLPVFRPLIHRSGLNGRVIVGGTIEVGDAISPVDPAALDQVLVAANEQHGLTAPPEAGDG